MLPAFYQFDATENGFDEFVDSGSELNMLTSDDYHYFIPVPGLQE